MNQLIGLLSSYPPGKQQRGINVTRLSATLSVARRDGVKTRFKSDEIVREASSSARLLAYLE